MDGSVDLHLHTTYSDGALSPRALVDRARRAGLTTISITDHDHVGGFEEAREAGAAVGVEVIPGVELSTNVNGMDIHMLGYFFDHRNPALLAHLSLVRRERVRRAEKIVEKLNGLRIPLRLESVLAQAGGGAVGRPHIALALLEEGLTGSYHEAFIKYIGAGKPAYEQKHPVSPLEAITLLSSAGGLSFIAHPSPAVDGSTLPGLIHDGINGIEVVHPSLSPERSTYYRGIVAAYRLLSCGGSDFHGGKRSDEDALGRFTISRSDVEMMRKALP